MSDPAIRICFVSPYIYPLFNPQTRAPFAEAEVQLFELARFLGRNESVEVSVVTGDYEQEEVEFYEGVLVYRMPRGGASPLPWMKRFFAEKNSLLSLLKKVDADVYVMSGWDPLAPEVVDFCVKQHRAFVYRVAHPRDCDGSFTKSLREEGEQFGWTLKQATRIVCQTETQRHLLRRSEKLDGVVLPNAVPFRSWGQQERREVVWIGEIVEWKQPEMFFRLALTLPQQAFTIFAYPRAMEYFERLVEKTRDIPNLGFQNNVPYPELPAFLERAKLLVNTSRFEGYPYYFSLAHAMGVPVASLNIDPDGLLAKMQVGICAHGSEVRLAEEVLALLSFENQLKRFRENAIAFSRHFNPMDKLGVEYLKLFIRCAGEAKN
ncbi:MAG: glycosyltransferase [bacterium]|nr:glycosyltransferase [bacterium]